jgi:hypothetical protein
MAYSVLMGSSLLTLSNRVAASRWGENVRVSGKADLVAAVLDVRPM